MQILEYGGKLFLSHFIFSPFENLGKRRNLMSEKLPKVVADTCMSHEDVHRVCTPKMFTNKSTPTDVLNTQPEFFVGCGQDRFTEALKLCVASDAYKHNVFVSGISGHNGFSVLEGHIRQILETSKRASPEFSDWCYVYNFDEPRYPVAVQVVKGTARTFRKQTKVLLGKLKRRISEVLDSKKIQLEKIEIEKKYKVLYERLEAEVSVYAHERGVHLETSNDNFRLLVYRKVIEPDYDGPPTDVVDPEIWENMTPEQHKKLEDVVGGVYPRCLEFLQEQQDAWVEKEAEIETLEYTFVEKEVLTLFDVYIKSISHICENDSLRIFCDKLQQHTLDQYDILIEGDSIPQMVVGGVPMKTSKPDTTDVFLPWKINVFVTHDKNAPVPIVTGGVTSLAELVGHVETVGVMGVEYTDHTKIYSGAFAKANGGYLILNVQDLLSSPDLWMFVKRVIKRQEITIETPYSLRGLQQLPLQPQAIPSDVRVILFGPSYLMGLLNQHDNEFAQLFQIRAELLHTVLRTPAQVCAYGDWLKRISKTATGFAITPHARCTLIEYAGRLSNHQERLSTNFAILKTLITEADVYRASNDSLSITDAHVQRALQQHSWRSSASYDRMHENIRESMRLIDVKGKRVGQINGLVVYGGNSGIFGSPSRITSRVSFGKRGVINIQRDAQLAGKYLLKADQTVRGLLKSTFAKKAPLALDIHFSFEQIGGVDGDSASLAEYIVILSSMSGVPITQEIAITGSINLHGDVQPIGGVNEKIEGFFDACNSLGPLTGTQGVIIPHQNKVNLMLRNDVVQKIKDGMFHVYAIDTLEQGIELLMNMSANSVNKKVKKELKKFTAGKKNKKSKVKK